VLLLAGLVAGCWALALGGFAVWVWDVLLGRSATGSGKRKRGVGVDVGLLQGQQGTGNGTAATQFEVGIALITSCGMSCSGRLSSAFMRELLCVQRRPAIR
jgi:hypothetical protein